MNTSTNATNEGNKMGFILTATNIRGTYSTFWVPASLIQQAYKSFDLDWIIECSKIMSRKPKNVQFHIKDRL